MPYWRSVFVIGSRYFMDLMALFRFLNEGKRKDAAAVSKAHRNFIKNLFKSEKTYISKDKSRLKGMYKGSIIVEFFMKKKHKFTELDTKEFY